MLYIAEKPELARAIASALGGGGRKNSYYECGGDRVTWCFGHMLRLYEPEEYDASLKKWTLDTLPLVFTSWKKRPVEKSKEQLQIILDLLKSADTVVNAGDPDAEGQLLVDEILAYAGFRGKTLRVLINDNTPALVKKALANLPDNADFAGLSAAAEARQVGDWHYGLNLTRLYTLVGRREGYSDMLSVGRSPDKVKDITQSLREKHRLITYNRSDSRYLSDEQHADAPAITRAIAENVPDFAGHIGRTDVARKSRAFDSSKVTAHHAIIPTQTKADISKLSPDEQRLYLLIARAYLVQFMPPQRWERTVATLEVEGHTFARSSRVVLENGWCDFYSGETDQTDRDDQENGEDDSAGVSLVAGGTADCLSGACLRKETAPKPLYTLAANAPESSKTASASKSLLIPVPNAASRCFAGRPGKIIFGGVLGVRTARVCRHECFGSFLCHVDC